MRVNHVLSTYANYGEAVNFIVKDLGTATPHIQALKLLSWMFSVSLADVKADCQEQWTRHRRQDQNRGGTNV